MKDPDKLARAVRKVAIAEAVRKVAIAEWRVTMEERSETTPTTSTGVIKRSPKRRGRRCKFCGEPGAATLQCDHPRPWRRPGSCDAHMCPRCASPVAVTPAGESVTFCPKHASQFAEFSRPAHGAAYRTSVIEKAQKFHADRTGRTEIGRTLARMAHVEAKLAQVEQVCAAHGFDAGAGESAAEWIETRLRVLDDVQRRLDDLRWRS